VPSLVFESTTSDRVDVREVVETLVLYIYVRTGRPRRAQAQHVGEPVELLAGKAY